MTHLHLSFIRHLVSYALGLLLHDSRARQSDPIAMADQLHTGCIGSQPREFSVDAWTGYREIPHSCCQAVARTNGPELFQIGGALGATIFTSFQAMIETADPIRSSCSVGSAQTRRITTAIDA